MTRTALGGSPRVTLAAATLASGAGGIADVARLCIRSLIESCRATRTVSYLDQAQIIVEGQSISACSGNKLRFLAEMHRHALHTSHFVFDGTSVARARPRLSFLNRPFALWMHGIEVWEGIRPSAAASIAKARLPICNSHYTLSRFERLHGRLRRASVCWLASGGDDEAPAQFIRDAPPSVLILGRIDATENYKGHRELIEIWPRVVEAVPDARLVIAGGGSGLEALKRTREASSAKESVHVLGFVPVEELDAVWNATDIFAMPSRGEGFGLVYIEAMRRGLPIIASVHDAGQEVNVHETTGFNVDLDRPGDLLDRLVTVLRDTALRRAFGVAGRERWRAHFQFRTFHERFSALLSQNLF